MRVSQIRDSDAYFAKGGAMNQICRVSGTIIPLSTLNSPL
nr:MAG TPA: protein of unknown function (DUF2093) [Caudoviricetes sp.]